ncbi:TPA: hypothetical protein PXR55_003976, partial [Yersinia enterocolitica]|nr:hypothetical protein [Yersinia enterocolitica]
MKCHKLAFVMILTAISTPSSYASTYEHSADQISITSVNGGNGNLQTAVDQITGAISGLSNDDYDTWLRLNALENAPKPKDGVDGKDGHDGTDDHHNDAAVQQNAKAL